jgi:hypothetical protein
MPNNIRHRDQVQNRIVIEMSSCKIVLVYNDISCIFVLSNNEV